MFRIENLDVIWNQTELGLVSKQSEECDYNPNLDVIWNQTELGLLSKQSEKCDYNPNLDVIWNHTELGLVSKQSEKCDYNPNLDVLIVLCGDCKYIINESKILPLNAPRFNYLIQLLQNTTVKIIKRRCRIELVYVHVNRPHKPTCP